MTGGLDAVAADALELPGYYETPPVVCYLDRGHGAAIRRARTRLPGGGENPVAIIRIPRERMVGSGIASSLVHEVGHQASALLGLVNSLRPVLIGMQQKGGREQVAWQIWERCISEILADFWAVAKVGVAATTGLMAVVSLPRAFVFRVNLNDPHPFPWIRAKLSCALGRAPHPHPQWDRLETLWESLYPIAGLDEERTRLIGILEQTLPSFVALMVNHRPRALRGSSLGEALSVAERQPEPAGCAARRVEACAAPDADRAADPGLRRDRPDKGGGKDQPGGRKPASGGSAHLLGAEGNPRHVRGVRFTGARQDRGAKHLNQSNRRRNYA